MLTPASRLQDFPALGRTTYLNTAAESIPPEQAGHALRQYWEHKQLGMRGREHHFAQAEACRETAARHLGLTPAEVAFCSCSSEAYNLLASALQLTSADEVVISDLDFPAGVTPWLRAPQPPRTHVWAAQEGALQTAALEPLLNARTRLVQVSLVSFYNGHRLAWAPFHAAVRQLAPHALMAVDVTQALGRVVLDCPGADILISSTHKWTLGIHGGCIIGIPAVGAERLTTRAGGWLHLENAFAADRFTTATARAGAPSFAVGMPNFAALYALNASLRYLEGVGVPAIEAHANPLTTRCAEGLQTLGLQLLAPWDPRHPSGILAFRHPRAAALHAALEAADIQIMHNAGRLRVSLHGYNTGEEVTTLLQTLAASL